MSSYGSNVMGFFAFLGSVFKFISTVICGSIAFFFSLYVLIGLTVTGGFLGYRTTEGSFVEKRDIHFYDWIHVDNVPMKTFLGHYQHRRQL